MCTVQNMFTIPGVIGPDKQKDAYPTVTKFLKDLHEFKEESTGDMVAIMDSKLTSERKKYDEKLVSVENSTKELLRAQEAAMESMKGRLAQLDDEMDKLLIDDLGSQSAASRKRGHRGS